jgi:hypothetical protein
MQALDPSWPLAPARTTDGECARSSQFGHWTFGMVDATRTAAAACWNKVSLDGRIAAPTFIDVQRLEVLLLFNPRMAIAGVAALVVSSSVASAQADTAIDPDAIAALNKMGAYLRTLNAFQVKATVTTEDVLDDGEKLQRMNTTTLLAQRPNKLFVQVVNERAPRDFYYDGKSFTLYAPKVKYYATVDAPPTIAELANKLEDKFNIEVPFVDLFRWGTPEGNVADITSATDVGPSVIDGTTCEQYAFRQNGLDWQVWIQEGDFPLPRKLVLTTLTDDARPQHTSVYTWNLAPSFNDEAFAFTAPKDASKIKLVDQTTAPLGIGVKKSDGGADKHEKP